ncbi:MAG: phospholipase [Planctomycetaceae bacterium]|nr:phospholipase [Planctomycetaceae bacterium]
MNLRRTQIGSLNCCIVDALPEGVDPSLVVILCHGFGASGEDLVPCGAELLNWKPALAQSVRFIMPAAPLALDDQGMPGSRAWWHIDMVKLTSMIEHGDFRDQRASTPEGLPESRAMLSEVVEQVCGQTGLPASRIVLGGFSQGAMLTTDLALHLDESPAALCIWSGTLLYEDVWRQCASQRAGLRIVQSHGRQDPLLDFHAAVCLRDLLIEGGAEVDFIEFDGIHTIPTHALERFGELLVELVSD